MAGRVTQLVVEAVIAATDANVRVTQVAVEAVIAPTSAAVRATQIAVEAVVAPVPNLVVTQAGLEVARTGEPGLLALQAGLEVARVGDPSLLVSQAGIEVAYEVPKGTFVLDARLVYDDGYPDRRSNWFTAGAWLKKNQTGSFGVSATIKKAVSSTFSAAAWKSTFFSVDAIVGGYGWGTLDAILLKTGPENALFPTVTETGGSAADATTHVITLPACDVGDLLIVSAATHQQGGTNQTWTFDGSTSKFTALYSQDATIAGQVAVRGIGKYRVMEYGDSTTLTITLSQLRELSWTILRIPAGSWNRNTPPQASTWGCTGVTRWCYPPALTPSWGLENTLWIAVVHTFYGPGGPPSGYTPFDVHHATRSSYRQLRATSETPPAYDTGGVNYTMAATIAVRPPVGMPFRASATKLATISKADAFLYADVLKTGESMLPWPTFTVAAEKGYGGSFGVSATILATMGIYDTQPVLPIIVHHVYSNSTATLNFGFTPTAGNILIAHMAARDVFYDTPPDPAGWTRLQMQNQGSGAWSPGIATYAKVSNGTETSISQSWGNGNKPIVVWEIGGGVASLSDLASVATVIGYVQTAKSIGPIAVPGNVAGLIVAFWAIRSDSTTTANTLGNGFTKDDGEGLTSWAAHYSNGHKFVLSGAGPQTPIATSTSSSEWRGHAVAVPSVLFDRLFKARAVVLGPRPGAFSASAYIAQHFDIDAEIWPRHFWTYAQIGYWFPTFAEIVPLRFATDAVVTASISSSFSASAVRLRGQTGSKTASAVIRKTIYDEDVTKLTVDARINPRFFVGAFIQPWFRVNAIKRETFIFEAENGLTADAYIPRFFRMGAFVQPYFFVGAELCLAFKVNAIIKATIGPMMRSLTYPGVSVTRLGQTANVVSQAFPISAGDPAVVTVVSPPSDGGDLGIMAAESVVVYPIPTTVGEHIVSYPGVGTYYVYSSKGNAYRPSLGGSGTYRDWGYSSLRINVDAFVQPNFRADAAIVWTFGPFPFTADAWKLDRVVSSFSVSAWVQPFFIARAWLVPRHFHADAWIRCDIRVSAWIIRRVTGSLSASAFVKPYFRAYAVKKRTMTGAFLAQSWLSNPKYGNFGVFALIQYHGHIDAAIKLTKYRRFTVSAVLRKPQTGSFSTEAFVGGYIRVDAWIFRREFFTYALVLSTGGSSLTAGANLIWTWVSPRDSWLPALTLDAFIPITVRAIKRETFEPSFTVQASKVVRVYASFDIQASITGFQTNAIIKGTQRHIFSIYAVKGVAHRSMTFSLYAEKYDPGAYWDPIYEVWLHQHFLVDAFFGANPESSFTVDAAFIDPGTPQLSFLAQANIWGHGGSQDEVWVEAEIDANKTIVYEGDGDIRPVLKTYSSHLTFPGWNGGRGNIVSPAIPFNQKSSVFVTMWVRPTGADTSVGLASRLENLWGFGESGVSWTTYTGVSPQPYLKWPSLNTVEFLPTYINEWYYVIASNSAKIYDAAMTGAGLVTYQTLEDVVFSLPAPTIDAWLVGTIGEPVTIDAEIVGTEKLRSLSVAAETCAAGERRGAFTVDAFFLGSVSLGFRVGADIILPRFTVDAVLSYRCGTIDAFIQPRFTASAVVTKTRSPLSFTVNAEKAYLQRGSTFAADADISPAGEMHGVSSVDALLIRTSSSRRIYLAACIASLASHFHVNAVIHPWFTVGAWLSTIGGGMGAFGIGAYVKGSSYYDPPPEPPPPGPHDPPLPPIHWDPSPPTRKFSILIEAGFADESPPVSHEELDRLNHELARALARLKALLCIPSDERIPAEEAEIVRLNELIADLKRQIAEAKQVVDEAQRYWNAMGRMQATINKILAIPAAQRTAAQKAALKRAQDGLRYDTDHYREAREVHRKWGDITGDVIWSGTTFTQAARTGAGTFTITMRGAMDEFIGGEEIHFEIDGLRVFGGWVTSVERGYFFSDYAEPRTVIHGVDYNILFDRLAVRNYPWELANYNATGANGGPYHPWPPFKKGTMDGPMIRGIFAKYVAPDLPAGFDYSTYVDTIATPAPVAPWLMPDHGSPLRKCMESISQITSGVWYIDAYMCLHYHDRGRITAPSPITDSGEGVSCRNLTVQKDISVMSNDVMVWGTLAKDVDGQIMYEHVLGDGKWKEEYYLQAIEDTAQYIHNILAVPPAQRSDYWNEQLPIYQDRLVEYKTLLAEARANPETDSIATYGRWQWFETRETIYHQKWLYIRARAIMLRRSAPIVRATATVWEPGYQAGQVVNVKSSAHGLDENLVIRQLTISFAVPKEPMGGAYYAIPQYDLIMGLEPEAPWDIYDFLPYPGSNTPGLGMDTTGG